MPAVRSHPTSAASWSEERLLRWLRARAQDLELPLGHDACVLSTSSARPVLCTDHTIEGVHVRVGERARAFGAKAVLRVLSDLAATAAEPVAVQLALGAPPSVHERRLRALLEAVWSTARSFGAELTGGDLACRPGPLSLAVTALGSLPGRRRAPHRGRARAGQWLLCTGSLGGSSLGRHLRIRPRLQEGRALWKAGATGMMDTSDGLARDASRLAETADVCVRLEHVPVHPDARRLARKTGRSALDHALHDGEDHELLVTMAPPAARRALQRARTDGTSLCRVGRVVAAAGPNERKAPGNAPENRTGRAPSGIRGRARVLVPAVERAEGVEDGAELVVWQGEGGWQHGA